MNIRTITKRIFLGIILFIPLLFSVNVTHAAVILPDDLRGDDPVVCGELATAGTYTLTEDIGIDTNSSCFVVSANGVVIDGDGHVATTTSGNTRYAITTLNTLVPVGGSAYGITVKNIIFTNFGAGVNATGNVGGWGDDFMGVDGGAGGYVVVATSTMGNIVSSGGSNNGVFLVKGGVGGNIDISNSTVGTLTSIGGSSAGSGSNGRNGGAITISSNSVTGTVMTMGGDGGNEDNVGGTGGTVNIMSSSVEGTVTSAGGENAFRTFGGTGGAINISSSSVTGTVTSSGGYTKNGGVITISSNSTTGNVLSIGGTGSNSDIVSGSGGNISISDSTTGTVTTTGRDGYNGRCGGFGGAISVINSTTGDIASNSGDSGSIQSSFCNPGRAGGAINVSNSTTGTVTSVGGDNIDIAYGSENLYPAGDGGVITISASIVGNILSKGGTGGSSYAGAGHAAGNGGSAGNINFINSTTTGTIISLPGAGGGGKDGSTDGLAGLGATVVIASSVINDVSASGTNGAITISDEALDLANKTISTAGCGRYCGIGGTNGTLTLVYSGLVTNSSTCLNKIGDLIINGFHYGPWNGVFDPLIYYFTNSVDTDWNTLGNWWNDVNYTVPATKLPVGYDQVFINGLVESNSGTVATADTVVFNSTSSNAINISVTHDATFNASSTNTGTITAATTTFNGDNSSTVGGSVIGFLQRVFNLNATTTRDFTTEGNRNDWFIVAQNAIVDISGAVYDTAHNIFKALLGGWFVTGSNSGGQVVPNIVISGSILTYTGDPSTKTVKWAPSIDWDTSATCEYSYDNFATTHALTCSHADTSIPHPVGGMNTLYLRGTDSKGSLSERSLTFFYDNTSAIYTACGADLLDESTREYYYLTDNVAGSCTATANVELRGASSTQVTGFTVAGDIQGNGHNLVLKNITVQGSIVSNGALSGSDGGNITIQNSVANTISANGSDGVNGGNGGAITIATSTTSTISANGGDGTGNGGNGGTVNITYSYATASSTIVSSTGGDSTSCGNGGNGGVVSIVDSADYTVYDIGGSGHTCQSSGGLSGRSGGGGSVVGKYVPPVSPVVLPPSPPSVDPTATPATISVPSLGRLSFKGSIVPPTLLPEWSLASSTVPIGQPAPGAGSIADQVSKGASAAADQVVKATKATVSAIQTPAGSAVVNSVSTIGALFTSLLASPIFASPIAASEILFVPLRLWGLVLSALGLKRRNRPWGTVYDSVTKMPIDPAVVTLYDESGKKVTTSITDLDGRFGFIVPKGTYHISVQKTNYTFPSKKLSEKTSDELYSNLYFGEKIDVSEDGLVIYKNIPMDPQHFDWNEFTKNKMGVMQFNSLSQRFKVKIGNVVFWLGFAFSVVSVSVIPHAYSIVILLIYVILIVLRFVGLRRRIFGTITDGADHPLSYATISIFSKDLQRELFKKVADQFGRYYALVPKGEYEVKVSRKNADQSYTEVYDAVVNAKNGVINQSIKV